MSPSDYVQGGRPAGQAARRLQRLVLERRYGMPPGALRDVELPDIGFDAPGRVREHIPSPWGVLRRILPSREVTGNDVFIDIGCGMGPVLVEAAARYDFRRVIGIDVVPEFTRVARETIARGRQRMRCREIEVVTGDVIEYDLPDDVTVVYMADPFRSHLFDAAIAKLVDSVDRNPRRLRVIYHYPAEGGRLERTGRARLVRCGRRRGRPWAKTFELVMYEIEPRGDAGRPAPPPSPGVLPAFRRRLRGRSLDGGSGSGDEGAPAQAPEARVQIASSGSSHGASVVFDGSEQDLRSARAAFERHHCVRLPRFLSGALLERVQQYVNEGEFASHEGVRTELSMVSGKAAELLLLLVNDRHLFELLRSITGCERIGRLDGGVHRMVPGPEHEDRWHGEIFGHGIVEMSIDLSGQPYSGGVTQIRDRYSHDVYTEGKTEPGDALLVRVAPFLQRRVTTVEGDSPRTVYAGKFRRGTESKLARPRAGELTTGAGSAPRRPPATPRR